MNLHFLASLGFYTGAAVVLAVLAAGCWRILRGPTTLDRVVGLDTLTVAIVGLTALFSIRANTAEYVELILVVTALGFFTTVCFYYYLSQPRKQGGEDFNREDKA
jgi:multicomponent Na+:H+ antiporter subunit F